jgi:hypothetical protein
MTMERYRQLSLRTRLMTGAVYFALGIIAVALAVVMYWSLTGRDALDVKNTPLPVKPVVVKSEETVYLTVHVCKKTTANGRVSRRFVSNRTELLSPTVNEGLGQGCYENLEVPVPIPPQTPPGRYRINYRVTYRTNPMHTVVEDFSSDEFEVIE